MDLLIVESIEPEVMAWLAERHHVHHEPDFAFHPSAFRRALRGVCAAIVPATVAVDAQVLRGAPKLQALGRVSSGAENIDLAACARAGVEVVRSLTATAQAEAEFTLGCVLALMRRVPVVGSGGMLVGRELSGSTVGLVGMSGAARSMVQLLGGFGVRVVGYDPSLHAGDPVWSRWRILPLGLRELLEQSDAVCVQLGDFKRYHGLLGDRLLPFSKPDQVIVSLSHSSVFDEDALAVALESRRIAAAWFDSLEPGLLDRGRPLHGIDHLQVTPRLAGTTRESRLRSAWTVAKRIDELLSLGPAAPAGFRPSSPGELPVPAGEPVLR